MLQARILDDDRTGGLVDLVYGSQLGPDGTVRDIDQYADGSMILVGSFAFNNRVGIMRVGPDGTTAVGFAAVQALSGGVNAVAIDRNINPLLANNVGKIVVGGAFSAIQIQTTTNNANGIARLNSDGTYDSTFNVGSGANGEVLDVLVQPDGRVVLAGSFSFVQGVARGGIARLNANGSLDTGFNVGSGANSTVEKIVLQSDGKLVLGGSFTSFNGARANRIVRLNANGTIDSTFDPGSGANATVRSIAVDTSGNLFVGGDFSGPSFSAAVTNKTVASGIATLQTDAAHGYVVNNVINVSVNDPALDGLRVVSAVDAVNRTFSFSTTSGNQASTAVSPVGFASAGGHQVNRVVKLGPSGAVDSAFMTQIGGGPSGEVTDIVLDNGKLVVGGTFSGPGFGSRVVNRSHSGAVATLQTARGHGLAANEVFTVTGLGDGYDGTYQVASVPDATTVTYNVTGNSSASTPVSGAVFLTPAGVHYNRIVRLNSDGSVDSGTDYGSGFNGDVNTLALNAAGLTVGGSFTSYDGRIGLGQDRFVRLDNSAGSRTGAYNYGGGWNASIEDLALETDGRLIIAGDFTDSAIERVGRVDAGGSLDEVFQGAPGTGPNDTVRAVAIDRNTNEFLAVNVGKILIGGVFTTFNGTTVNRIARLNVDGSLDTTFNAGTGADNPVNDVAVDANGRVYVGGQVTSVGGVQPRTRRPVERGWNGGHRFHGGAFRCEQCGQQRAAPGRWQSADRG